MLTVLIATRNGSKTLPSVLEAYCGIISPLGGWQLVIVDNGSTDKTKDIITSFEGRLSLTYVFEPRDGKNMALNAGLAYVSGDLVVLTDDDAFPRPDWLAKLREAADLRSETSIFGGSILPRWETQPPDWILKWVPLAPAFALSDTQLTEGPIGPNKIFGPNMAIRTDVFQAGHRFDVTIGPRGSGSYPMGSETELVRRLARQGMSAWHVHAAIVEHFIRKTQMQKSWLVKRAVRFGRGQYRLAHKQDAFSFSSWFGIPRYMFRQLFHHVLSMLPAVVLLDREKLFGGFWQLGYLWGQMTEARIMRTDEVKAARDTGR